MKKRFLVWIAALCVLGVAAAVFMSGALNPKVYLRITNQTGGEVYGYWMYYSYQGKTGREAEMAQGVSKPTGNPGDNARLPLAPGESVTVTMDPNRIQNVPVSEELTVELYVFDRPIRTAEDQRLENAARAGDAVTVPARTGKCSRIVVTGNREDGFRVTFAGFANWLSR